MFRESYHARRCLIPASGWFEWDHREKRPPRYRFRSKKSPWLWLAGLYRVDNPQEPRFVVVTRQAKGALADFHDRMPLCFLPGEEERWMAYTRNPDDVADSLVPDDFLWEKDSAAPGSQEQLSMI